MKKLQAVRGTKDIYGEDYLRHLEVIEIARQVVSLHGFEGLSTPIIEFAEVYSRSLGEVSDVVTKEMYNFTDKGGESITMRPEFTAGVCRSFISEGMMQNLPLRLFSHGPLFRYERPQKGRQRQFHQINIEALGVKSPSLDAEIVALGYNILSKLGIADKVRLEINTLGDKISRDNYRSKLVAYLADFESELSEDSKLRLAKNPLRILDSKDDNDKKILINAPHILESLTDESREFFEQFMLNLGYYGVPFQINQKIVRGLDYYNDTAFEFVTDMLGSQGTVMAGGRYDSLIEELGGPSTPAFGFAAGIERLGELMQFIPKPEFKVAIINIGDELHEKAIELAGQLRSNGIITVTPYENNPGKKMKRADKMGANLAIIFGADEIDKNMVKFKNMKTGQEQEVKYSEILTEISLQRK